MKTTLESPALLLCALAWFCSCARTATDEAVSSRGADSPARVAGQDPSAGDGSGAVTAQGGRRPELPFVVELREAGYPASARFFGSWYGSNGLVLPEARRSAEEAGRRCLRALAEGDLLALSSFFEGSQTPSWDLLSLSRLSIPVVTSDAVGKDVYGSSGPNEARGYRLEQRNGLGVCLVSLESPESEPFVFRSRGGVWFLRPPNEMTATMQGMLGPMVPSVLAQALAFMDTLQRGLSEQWSKEQMDSFMASASVDLAARISRQFSANAAYSSAGAQAGSAPVPVTTPFGVNPALTGNGTHPWISGR